MKSLEFILTSIKNKKDYWKKVKKPISSKDFIYFYFLKNTTTSKMKTNQERNKLEITRSENTRANTSEIMKGFVNFQATKGTHWVMFKCESCYDSFGCPPQEKSSK